MDAIDPFVVLTMDRLREVVCWCVEWGRMRMSQHGGVRMEERDVSGGEILNALQYGVHAVDGCVAGKWRYLARRKDVEVCFSFDTDDQGNLLILVTVIRKD